MATIYGDFQAFVTSDASMYPISYSGAGIFNVSPFAGDLLDLLPSYYFLGNNNRRIMELIAVVMTKYQDRIGEVQDQFFVETATWGLDFWEQLVGLPINSGNLDFATRRADVLNKLRDCSSEKCFVEGLEAIVLGPVIVKLLDPETNPYQVDLELRTNTVVYNGPISAPTASVGGSGPLTGDYTYKVTYEFPPIEIPNYIGIVPDNNGETSSGVAPIRTNEVQVISATGTVSGGVFNITYDSVWDTSFPPNPRTTADLPWDATRTQIKDALEALPNVTPGTLVVTGGPLPTTQVVIEFAGDKSGFPQSMMTVNSSSLTGGGNYDVARAQTGDTTYGDSESNTVTAASEEIILSGVPTSPDGAIRRNIYRKKNSAPYNEYRFVGSIDDNVTTLFVDDIPDEDLSETQELDVSGIGSFKLRFDSVDTSSLTQGSSAVDVKNALEAISTVSFPTVGVSVTGVDVSSGVVVKFDGGDVEGKDVPEMEIVDATGSISGTVVTTGPRRLVEENTAFTFIFQRAVEYIYNTKPSHLRIHELRSAAFRASISHAGEPV